jgi:hypothetical protein
MPRPTAVLPVAIALGALTVSTALTTSALADPGQQHQRHRGADRSGPVSVHQQGKGHGPFGSVAVFGGSDGGFQAARGITGSRAHKTAYFDLNRDLAASAAVNPVGGEDGLLCGNDGYVYAMHGLRTKPRVQHPRIDATRYTGEGGSDYNFYCDGVAVNGSFGLATADSQGLLQLVRKHGTWKIDRRVQSRGLNDAGKPHRPGWIAFRDSMTTSTLFNNVVIAPRPLANGKYLAVALDRDNGTVVVVEGVGTAKPKVVGALSSDDLEMGPESYGNGGMAFVPGSRDKAVVITSSGFAVLALHHPAEPRLKAKTVVGDGLTMPSSITVSGDGDHLALSVGPRIYGYSNLRAAIAHGKKLAEQTSFQLSHSGTEAVSDVAYTGKRRLVVLHGDSDADHAWSLTLVTRVPAGHHAVQGSMKTAAPAAPGSLSVWPTP